jgi:anti-sigma factor ChrR (cupin superfamily)
MTVNAPPPITDASLNSDFSQRIVDHAATAHWLPSPLPGVTRRLLDRVLDRAPVSLGGEVARATSVVRYAPGSHFSRHVHDGGEEILVLEGVFSDETGDFPAGTYLRNPPGSAHAPHSVEGCLLFVKLRQFAPDDGELVCTDTRQSAWRQGLVPGLKVMPLHSHGTVSTALVRWAPNTQFSPHRHLGGEEIFVLDGVFRDEFGSYPAGSWLRGPCGSAHTPFTGPEGALIYVKVGHLGAGL